MWMKESKIVFSQLHSELNPLLFDFSKIQPLFRNYAFKWAVRTSVSLWCHNYGLCPSRFYLSTVFSVADQSGSSELICQIFNIFIQLATWITEARHFWFLPWMWFHKKMAAKWIWSMVAKNCQSWCQNMVNDTCSGLWEPTNKSRLG